MDKSSSIATDSGSRSIANKLPTGFTLDPASPAGGSSLPPGFTLDSPGFNEAQFQQWYRTHAQRLGLNPNPDDPQHFYDYRAAFSAGAVPNAEGHWPSKFKREGHPRLVLDGIDTRTGQPVVNDLPAGFTIDPVSDSARQTPTVESETLQPPDTLIPGFYGMGRVSLDPVDFLTGFGAGGLGAGLAKQGLKRIATEALRGGLGFQTGGLSEVRTLIKNIPAFIRNFRTGRGRIPPRVTEPPAEPRLDPEMRPAVRTQVEVRERTTAGGKKVPVYTGLQPGTRVKVPRQEAPPYVSPFQQEAMDRAAARAAAEGRMPVQTAVEHGAQFPETTIHQTFQVPKTPAELAAIDQTEDAAINSALKQYEANAVNLKSPNVVPMPEPLSRAPRDVTVKSAISPAPVMANPAPPPPEQYWTAPKPEAMAPYPHPMNGTLHVGGEPSPYDGRPMFDPQVNATAPKPVTYWERAKAIVNRHRQALPSELRVLKEAPQSSVMRAVDGMTADVTTGADTLVRLPWAQAFRRYTPQRMVQLEAQAVSIWEQGGRTEAALDRAIQAMPTEIQQMLRYRQSRLPIEQAARATLGLPAIPETHGPYFPRMSEQGLQDVQSIAGGIQSLGHDLQTTVKSFQDARTFRTMADGQANGMVYIDPRTAWAMREWHSLKLEATAKLLQNLDGHVLFRTAEAAKAASPTGKAFVLEGLPGAARWYSGSSAERDFLTQNLSRADRGRLGSLIGFANQLFRNPNLFNPLPHFTKNMLYKYGLSRGPLTKVMPDMLEYERAASPLVSRFKAVFPAPETAQSAGQALDPFLHPTGITHKALRALGAINRPSSTAIFAHLDPALRYARWKQYVAKGLTEQEAANHVQVDLIRYGTRSDAVDFWKSIPLNFFVPWRVGTVTSVVKQLTSHPLRAAAFIGAVDYLREARYRASGRWTHIPTDYVESPVTQALAHPTPKTLGALAATTALFGPGGASTASTLRDAIDDIRGGDEWGRIRNMFWGLSQIYEVPAQWQAFQQDGDSHHLVNILTSAAVAEHSALNYSPRRLASYLPEWLPLMEKSEILRQAEAIQAQRQAKGEAIRARKALRPRKTIEEILQVAP